ncbi:hypothetical protein G7K_3432-t1 [Saitoella complicata NRRL Y-17804]|uniref:Uncharacterized protein n=1 Tax=Saitoella complicata (strain BCRC 22490 / CBS 7301 / JCM 7358 / NBRC 10748 / NRRL Y-17804) TaxID=698492 RepID=A0A0E9NIP1_SAICN|nr:hypothetical protein G7K_3432-t1 [Saitoella complicata NRRL Y-17804]
MLETSLGTFSTLTIHELVGRSARDPLGPKGTWPSTRAGPRHGRQQYITRHMSDGIQNWELSSHGYVKQPWFSYVRSVSTWSVSAYKELRTFLHVTSDNTIKLRPQASLPMIMPSLFSKAKVLVPCSSAAAWELHRPHPRRHELLPDSPRILQGLAYGLSLIGLYDLYHLLHRWMEAGFYGFMYFMHCLRAVSDANDDDFDVNRDTVYSSNNTASEQNEQHLRDTWYIDEG